MAEPAAEMASTAEPVASPPLTAWVIPPTTPVDWRSAYGEWIQRAE